MRINKWWKLTRYMTPQKLSDTFQLSPATKEEYDNSTIIHFGRYFKPIVLTDNLICSGGFWTIADFWKDLNTAISLCKKKAFNGEFLKTKGEWGISRNAPLSRNEVHWGCRVFTLKQLETIRGAMKWHYTRKQLRGIE